MRKRLVIRRLVRLAREERGSELVEFAMCALILMGLLVGVIQFAIAMYTYHFLSTAAQEGTRFAMVRGNTWSTYQPDTCTTSAPPNFTMPYNCEVQSNDVQNYVQSLATMGINANGLTVTYTPTGYMLDGVTACSPVDSQGCVVQVKVSYTFQFLPFVYEQMGNFSMSATSEGVILQ